VLGVITLLIWACEKKNYGISSRGFDNFYWVVRADEHWVWVGDHYCANTLFN
jgi:hypothetical protein